MKVALKVVHWDVKLVDMKAVLRVEKMAVQKVLKMVAYWAAQKALLMVVVLAAVKVERMVAYWDANLVERRAE